VEETLACPACGKGNSGTSACVRCGCDLSVLNQLRGAEETLLAEGGHQLRAGSPTRALRFAEEAWRLRNSAPSARLALLACLSLGDFAHATHWYARTFPPQ